MQLKVLLREHYRSVSYQIMSDLTCLSDVECMLRHAPLNDKSAAAGYPPFLETETARSRAQMVCNAAKEIPLKWTLSAFPMGDDALIPSYKIPGSEYGKSNSDDAGDIYKGHGIGLDEGSLLRFARACEVGYCLLSGKFPSQFKKDLRNPAKHLSTVEELIWLSSWHGITNISHEQALWKEQGSNKKVDWRFESCGMTINLEVKYRARDWARRVDGPQYNIVKDNYYHDLEGKFIDSKPNELNIVGVTSYAEPDRSWREETHTYLVNNPHVDAIILWCPSHSAADNQQPFEIQSKKKELISTFLKVVPEDSFHLVGMRYLLRDKAKRQAARVEDVIDALSKYPAASLQRTLRDNYS